MQGNQPDELPEVVLACARVSRVDLFKVQPFPATLRESLSRGITVELDPAAPPLVCNTFPDDGVPQQNVQEDARVLAASLKS